MGQGRGKAFTEAERDIIRLWRENKKPMSHLAKRLGRARSTIYRQIDRMKEDGSLSQSILDVGQGSDE